MTIFQCNIIVMQYVFANEIVCKMTTIIEENSQSDLGPADGPVNVHLAVAAAVTALHPTGQHLIVCGTPSLGETTTLLFQKLQSPFPRSSTRWFTVSVDILPVNHCLRYKYRPRWDRLAKCLLKSFQCKSGFIFWWGYLSWLWIKLMLNLMADDLTERTFLS